MGSLSGRSLASGVAEARLAKVRCREYMQELVDKLVRLAPWHMDLELAPGVRTVDGNSKSTGQSDHERVQTIDPFEIRELLERIYPQGFAGRSFLDVGCNGGGYCLVAKSLGAGRTFGFDVRQHWIDQAEFLREQWSGNNADMSFAVGHIHDVDLGPGYDVTLFKGVFYHLPDPIGSLLRLCEATREVIIVDTASRSDIPENALVSNQESKSHVMSGVDGLAWLPGGPKAVTDILMQGGFPVSHVVYWNKDAPDSLPDWGRFRVAAARIPETFVAALGA